MVIYLSVSKDKIVIYLSVSEDKIVIYLSVSKDCSQIPQLFYSEVLLSKPKHC